MKKIVITMKDDLPHSIKIDNEKTVPIDCFFLTTQATRSDCGHMLAQGNSDDIGRMLFGFFTYCVKENVPEMALTMEAVARDIIDAVARPEKETLSNVSSKTAH